MSSPDTIFVGTFDGFSWLQCRGKGSFANSPTVKSFGESRIRSGERKIVVDLEACTAMDSTFMGTLAGLANHIRKANSGLIEVARPGEKNLASLEELGLDFLLEVHPENPSWEPCIDEIRAKLAPASQTTGPSKQLILEAHQTLSDTNEKNAQTFCNVVTMLEKEAQTP